MSNWEVFVSDESDEWATPPGFVRPLAEAMGGFDLDPCSGAESSPIARKTFTEADDGLRLEWYGDVWLNPPYSEVGRWLEKAMHEVSQDAVTSVLALIKGDTSTDWYQRYAFQANAICFIDGRLTFGDADHAAPFPSHLLIYGDVPESTLHTLDHHGTVIEYDTITRSEQQTITTR